MWAAHDVRARVVDVHRETDTPGAPVATLTLRPTATWRGHRAGQYVQVGLDLPGSVAPFILRGVKLLGINANSPMPLRRQVWGKIATRYRPARLDAIAHVIEPAALPQSLDAMLRRASRGRTVVDFS